MIKVTLTCNIKVDSFFFFVIKIFFPKKIYKLKETCEYFVTAYEVSSNLQHRGHEDRAAHERKDHEASETLFSDAQELGLLSRSRALRLQLQTVHVGDGEHGGRHKPRQAHHRAHAQHDPHHKQVQVVTTAFLQGDEIGTDLSTHRETAH